MDDMNRKELRLKKTRILINECGGAAKFAELLGMSDSQVSQFAGENPTRGIGNIVAGRIEAALLKPTGWLDDPRIDYAMAIDATALDVPKFSRKEDNIVKLLSELPPDEERAFRLEIEAAAIRAKSRANRGELDREPTTRDPPLEIRRI